MEIFNKHFEKKGAIDGAFALGSFLWSSGFTLHSDEIYKEVGFTYTQILAIRASTKVWDDSVEHNMNTTA